MRTLTTGERFQTYINTLSKCGVFLLDASDEEIAYNIFEEFEIGVISFLYQNNLDLFEAKGFIDDEIATRSRLLRAKVLALKDGNLWNVSAVKNSLEWFDVMRISDEIKELLKIKWMDSDMKFLFSEK